ncbi:MAG: type II toxin-antitoxin system HicB family antitoxin [Acidobacteria bacterium]|jgi:predicted RNase H-like HicB family nuclease|nr:type II toxin-antitoxin system HicB family antitoxin [Acidobacteriota bacterium]
MHRFLVVVERAGANYSAFAPDLPGCIATGDTVEETRRNMQEAIELHLQGLKEDDLPIPEPGSFAEFVEVAS